MWERIKRTLSIGAQPIAADAGVGYHVYRVRFPDGGFHEVMSLLSPAHVSESGLAGEAIMGGRPIAGDGETLQAITAENFRPNKLFLDLLHEVIATQTPGLPEVQDAARGQAKGTLGVCDARTPTPAGDVPLHDILGWFEVKDGAVVPGTYEPNRSHQLISSRGIFRLDPRVHQHLMDKLIALQQARNRGAAARSTAADARP